MPFFKICGLTVASDMDLPGASRMGSEVDGEVRVRRGSVPVSLPGAQGTGPNWALADDSFLLRVPRVARFLIRAGREILVESEPGVHEADAMPFLLGSALSVLLHQRGQVALHACAVEDAGRSFLLCGKSGAGKSTLGAALCQAGCAFLNDDLCLLGVEQGRVTVLPDGRQMKLWEESLDHLVLQDHRSGPVRSCINKFFVDPPGPAAAQVPQPVGAIYVLREQMTSMPRGIQPMSLPDSAQALEAQVFRPKLVELMKLQRERFSTIAALVAQAPVFWLTRPRELGLLGDTVASLRAHWRELP